MQIDLLIHSANQLLTLAGGAQRGDELGSLGIIEDGAVAIHAGDIVAVGTTSELKATYSADKSLDASGRLIMPGFVDPHTHLIWAGDRAAEFEMRIAGASYMEIMQAGGGIVSTVKQTRSASMDDLVAQSLPRLTRALRNGTTTMEAKTGYGLETQAELRALQSILELDAAQPLDLVPTHLGAHAIPGI